MIRDAQLIVSKTVDNQLGRLKNEFSKRLSHRLIVQFEEKMSLVCHNTFYTVRTVTFLPLSYSLFLWIIFLDGCWATKYLATNNSLTI